MHFLPSFAHDLPPPPAAHPLSLCLAEDGVLVSIIRPPPWVSFLCETSACKYLVTHFFPFLLICLYQFDSQAPVVKITRVEGKGFSFPAVVVAILSELHP